MAFMLNIIWGALTAFFPLYALSQGVTNPGLFFAAFALMLILGRTFGGKILDLYSRDKIMFPCLITYIVAMLILVFSTNLPMFILVAVIWGLAHAFLYPTLVIFAIDRAGPSRGPAIATFTAIGDLGVGLGSLIMGIILQLSSYRIMFLCLVITVALNFLYFYFFVRKKGGNGYAHL
jgi:MFS family permease